MRLAFDATPLIGPGTGVATFTRGAAGALVGRGDVDVVAYGLTGRGSAGLGAAVPAGVEVADRAMPAGPLSRVWSKVPWPPVEWWTGPIDVVHGTNFVVPPSRRAASVVSVYDLTSVRYPDLCAPASLRYPDLIRSAVKRGAWVHTLANAIAAEVIELLRVPEERVRVVTSGLDVPTPDQMGDAKAGHRIAGAERYVLALGTIEPRKGLPDLVRAFDRLAAHRSDVALVVAGANGWGTAAFDAAVSMARYGARIRRMGWVTGRVRADLLAGAAVLAVPSVYEGFGYPPLEAMAAGTPVVASAVGSLPEVLDDAACLIPANDVDALTTAILAVLDDEGVAADLQRKGRANVERFRWDSCAAGLVELYQDAIASRGSSIRGRS